MKVSLKRRNSTFTWSENNNKKRATWTASFGKGDSETESIATKNLQLWKERKIASDSEHLLFFFLLISCGRFFKKVLVNQSVPNQSFLYKEFSADAFRRQFINHSFMLVLVLFLVYFFVQIVVFRFGWFLNVTLTTSYSANKALCKRFSVNFCTSSLISRFYKNFRHFFNQILSGHDTRFVGTTGTATKLHVILLCFFYESNHFRLSYMKGGKLGDLLKRIVDRNSKSRLSWTVAFLVVVWEKKRKSAREPSRLILALPDPCKKPWAISQTSVVGRICILTRLKDFIAISKKPKPMW